MKLIYPIKFIVYLNSLFLISAFIGKFFMDSNLGLLSLLPPIIIFFIIPIRIDERIGEMSIKIIFSFILFYLSYFHFYFIQCWFFSDLNQSGSGKVIFSKEFNFFYSLFFVYVATGSLILIVKYLGKSKWGLSNAS